MNIHAVYKIECAVLSTILFSDEFGIEIPALPKPEYFYHPFNRHVAELMQKAKASNVPMSLLMLKLEGAVSGTQNERDFVAIVCQTPVVYGPYLKELKRQAIARELNHA